MNIIKQVGKSSLIIAYIICLLPALVTGQPRRHKRTQTGNEGRPTQLRSFIKQAEEAGIDFTFPPVLKEVTAISNENLSFDYAMAMPGQNFEIWLQVRSLKQNWTSYEQVKNITGKMLANPDSSYIGAIKANACVLSDDDRYTIRSLKPELLEAYNADAGKSCLVSLADLPETKGFKYALLIALQKDHTGYLLAVCLTNDKGPDFFRSLSKVRECIKFR
ncbi:hypothetical protein [Mucilaginibacter sp. CSA2-8R]|uniref:hypothetical protein n=1 Tax=Mucilaginibacter sp. CSA2-8R TaxID=3141542 RepID=UPI00315CB70D